MKFLNLSFDFFFLLHLQTYDIQGNLQNDSQVTVSVIFENKSTSFLKSMELNVLDSLNTKMLRPEGSSVHDGIPVPFQLPPGMCSFAQGSWSVSSPTLPSCGKSCLNLLLLAVFQKGLSLCLGVPWAFAQFTGQDKPSHSMGISAGGSSQQKSKACNIGLGVRMPEFLFQVTAGWHTFERASIAS